jgi:N-acetylneuraminic acid mutarotase
MKTFTPLRKATLGWSFALLTVMCASAQSPDSWTRRADLTGTMVNGPTARSSGFSFSIGTKGYIGGGQDVLARTDFWEFDPASGVWTQKASVNVASGAVGFSIGAFGYAGSGSSNAFYRYDPAANAWAQMASVGGSSFRKGAYYFSFGSYGYIGGGVNSAQAQLSDLWQYDPGANSWTSAAATPSGLDWYAAMTIGVKAYLIARDTALGSSLASVREYNPATNTWATKSAFPSGPRAGAVTFSFGNTGFLCSGSDAVGGFSDLWQYYPATDTWIQRSSLPGGISRTYSSGFRIATKGYLCTGKGAEGVMGDCFAYDTISQAWTYVSRFGKIRTGAVAFSINGKGYLGTGNTGPVGSLNDLQRDFWMFDPATNVWTQRADFAGAARSEAVGFSTGDKGYVGTGRSASGFESDFWEYDPVNNSWTARASFPGGARSQASGFGAAGKGYIGMGSPGSGLDFYQYDPKKNSWTQKAAVPAGASSLCFAIGRKGYAVGGNFWEYDPDRNTWAAKTPPPFAGNYGYSIGGRGYLIGSGHCEYDPDADAWRTLHIYFAGNQLTGPSMAMGIGNYGYAGGSYTNTFPVANLTDFWQYTPPGIVTAYNGVSVCANDTLPFLVPYFTAESYAPGNAFTAQLSDSSGSFATPMGLMPMPGSAPGQLILQLPLNITSGDHYKLRVVSSNPVIIGSSVPLVFSRPHPALSYFNGIISVQSGFQSYLWYKDSLFIFGATGTSYNPLDNGVYRVAVRDANGCRGFSDSVVISGLAVAGHSAPQNFATYPNPVRDVVRFSNTDHFDVALFRTDGTLCMKAQQVQQLDMSRMPAGLYFLRARNTVSGRQNFVRLTKIE